MSRTTQAVVFIGIVFVVAIGAAFVTNTLRQRARLKALPANYEGKDLRSADFRGKKLDRANFRGANLFDASMDDSSFRHADLREANLKDARIANSDFSHARFDGAKWAVASGTECAIFRQASFRDTDLSWRSFHGMGGTQNQSVKRHLLDPTTGGADMNGAVFDGADCRHTFFRRCTLAGASFRGADCREAYFENADLRNADFTDADLRGASLDNANTTGAVFTNAKRGPL